MGAAHSSSTGEQAASSSCSHPTTKLSGEVVLICHEQFEDGWVAHRAGTKADVRQLKSALGPRGLGLNVTLWRDYTSSQVKESIAELSTSPSLAGSSCLVVVVMSHGNSRGLLCAREKDGYYSTSDIWGPFQDSTHLRGVPKIFIFQSCRGSGEERVLSLSSNSTCSSGPTPAALNYAESFVLPRPPYLPDFFIGYSSIPGTQSVRHQEEGSWYLQAWCTELQNSTPSSSRLLFDLATRVNSRLCALWKQKSSDKPRVGQTPLFTSFLREDYTVPRITATPRPVRRPCTETIRKTAVLFDTLAPGYMEQLDTDGEGNLPAEQTHYETRTTHVVLIATPEFEPQAVQLALTLPRDSLLHMEDAALDHKSLVHVMEQEQIVPSLQHLSKDDWFSSPSSCLMVIILSHLSEEISYCEKTGSTLSLWRFGSTSSNTDTTSEHLDTPLAGEGSGVPVYRSWLPFRGSTCPALLGRPKVFLYLDPSRLQTDDIRVPSHRSQAFEPTGTITQHADFLLGYGFGEAFLERLKSELFTTSEDLLRALTRLMHPAEPLHSELVSDAFPSAWDEAEESGNSESASLSLSSEEPVSLTAGMLQPCRSYLESSLRFNISINESNIILLPIMSTVEVGQECKEASDHGWVRGGSPLFNGHWDYRFPHEILLTDSPPSTKDCKTHKQDCIVLPQSKVTSPEECSTCPAGPAACAVVSYAPEDQGWVEKRLAPELEGLGDTRLCFARRDHTGCGSERGLANCLQNRSRVILVLSPAYLQSRVCASDLTAIQRRAVSSGLEWEFLVPIQLRPPGNGLPALINVVIKTGSGLIWPRHGETDEIADFFQKLRQSIGLPTSSRISTSDYEFLILDNKQ